MNHLIQLKIQNYKGFFDEQIVDFAIPDNQKDGSGLTIIVGPNNTGKTTLIETLLFTKEKKFRESERHKNQQPTIVIVSNDAITRYTNIDGGSQVHVDNDHKIKFEVIPSRRYWQYRSNETWSPETFADQSNRLDVRNSPPLNTAAALMGINKNSIQKEKLNQYLKELIPHFSNWTIDTNDETDYVKYGIAGNEHQASFLGDGIISLFRICAHLINEDNNRILIMDEPELSLHPTAQKTLAKILSIASRNKQIIICTHSPYFTNWEDFSNGAKIVRLNKVNDKQCEVSHLYSAKNYGKFIENNLDEWQKPQMLDIVMKEVLFADNILFVEGQQDVGLIRKWLKDNYSNQKFDIFGYGVGSYSNMRLFLEMARDLKLRKVATLYDSGEDADRFYETDKKEYPDYCFQKLPTTDIRDKIDVVNSKEGVFDKSGIIKDKYKEQFNNIINNFVTYFQ